MTFLGQDKPLLEDVIEHHGVKGQKWGVRRKPTTNDIKDARYNVHQQAVALSRQRMVARRQTGAITAKREAKKYEDLKASFLKDPDRVTSLRMTKGEKVVTGILAVSVVGLTPAAAFVGTRVIARKAVERNVRNNTLNK